MEGIESIAKENKYIPAIKMIKGLLNLKKEGPKAPL
tara:strand:- start:444 stop:551 length:108 start_codon:yes stop_codon:yes gene_type:complete